MLQPAALRPRAGQPALQGDRLPLPLHDARGGAQAARAPAPRAAAGAAAEPYRYEREVEEFLRRSPNVRSAARRPAQRRAVARRSAPGEGDYADLTAREVIALVDSLDAAALAALREHEAAGAGRSTVLAAIDGQLAAVSGR